MKHAIIFDLDGTLLSTLDDIAHCMNEALTRQGLPTHQTDSYRYFVGSGVHTLTKRAVPENTSDAVLSLVEKAYRELYAIHQFDVTLPYDGITEMLKTLNAKSIPIAILSNKPHDATIEVVAKFFPEVNFAYVLGQRDNVPLKPDPTAALELAKLLDKDVSEIFYIGDSDIDMKTGLNAKMTTIGVLWGFRTKEELVEAGATFIVSAPQEIIDICAK